MWDCWLADRQWTPIIPRHQSFLSHKTSPTPKLYKFNSDDEICTRHRAHSKKNIIKCQQNISPVFSRTQKVFQVHKNSDFPALCPTKITLNIVIESFLHICRSNLLFHVVISVRKSTCMCSLCRLDSSLDSKSNQIRQARGWRRQKKKESLRIDRNRNYFSTEQQQNNMWKNVTRKKSWSSHFHFRVRINTYKLSWKYVFHSSNEAESNQAAVTEKKSNLFAGHSGHTLGRLSSLNRNSKLIVWVRRVKNS